MKKKQWFGAIILMLAGISIFLYPKISNYLARKNQIEVIREYKESISKINEDEISVEYEKAKKYNEKINAKSLNYANEKTAFNNYETILNVSNNGIMAYIDIPKISAYLPIYHGTSDEVMKRGVGHLENTSLPIGGENTHCVLTGHTGLSRAEIFTRLNELELDDYFYINTLKEKLIYQIYQIKVILPTELEDLQMIEGEDLVTLVTCTPYGINTHRLLVQGERVEGLQEIEDHLKEDMKWEENVNKNNYYLIGILYGLTILVIIIIFCIIYTKVASFSTD